MNESKLKRNRRDLEIVVGWLGTRTICLVSVLSARRMERLVGLRTDKVALVSTRALVTSLLIEQFFLKNYEHRDNPLLILRAALSLRKFRLESLRRICKFYGLLAL